MESLEKEKIIARVAYHQGAWYWLYVLIEWRGRGGWRECDGRDW